MLNKSLIAQILCVSIVLSVSGLGSEAARPQLKNALKVQDNVNGGSTCAGCTIVVSLVEQLALVYNQTVENALDQLCGFLPDGIFSVTCKTAVLTFGEIIIEGIYAKESSDVICHTLKICRTDSGQPECHLYPKKSDSIALRTKLFERHLVKKNIKLMVPIPKLCDVPIFKAICTYFEKIFDTHEPGVDFDKDGHGTEKTLRGASWKGKDCNDLKKNVHPGFKPNGGDVVEDTNCNGIFGKPTNSTQSWEDTFCTNSGQIGVAILGDSVGAHFHIPEQWMDASQINKAVFKDLIFAVENELDWPQLSATTGFMNSTWFVTPGPMRSLYQHMVDRNRCNFRDYQNVGVNGARVGSELEKDLIRVQNEDQPLLLALSFVGNDVCNGHPDTFNHMTPPDEYRKQMLKSLAYLDTVLPKGSHVIVTGVANGSMLYDTLYDQYHPIGKTQKDVKYGDIYTYLSCLQISPCNGWMTVNATVRKMTTDWAVNLSAIGKNVTETMEYKNFDMLFLDTMELFTNVFANWIAVGGDPVLLIEPVDGFHTSQIANALAADENWRIITTKKPDWIGPVNPFNDMIIQEFGSQGGYY